MSDRSDAFDAERPDEEPAGSQSQPKRRRGRPKKSPEERQRESERRLPESFEGRMAFRPGMYHVLNEEMREASNLRLLIAAEIERISTSLAVLQLHGDPGAAISREENALKALLWKVYHDHKHREHILAVFLSIRRRRLRAKLQAVHTALEIVEDLLKPDERILHDLQQALGGHLNPKDLENPEAAGIIGQQHIYGDTDVLHEQLAAFDLRVKQIRATMSEGVGWFEQFYVTRERDNPAAFPYLQRNEPVPPEIPLRIVYQLGPYLKFRWRESGYGPKYTLSMGLIPVEERLAAKLRAQMLGLDQQQESDPWPNL